VLAFPARLERIAAACCNFNGVPLLPQRGRYRMSQTSVVLDDKDAHQKSLRRVRTISLNQ
jgi:hypothetical protein